MITLNLCRVLGKMPCKRQKLFISEGVKVSVTPTISQKNLYEIVDLTNHFTGKGIPVWYCLYSYDTSVDSKQLFRIGKANDEFVITDKPAMVNLCNSLIEMRKKNNKILMTDKLIKALRSLYEKKAKDLEMPSSKPISGC